MEAAGIELLGGFFGSCFLVRGEGEGGIAVAWRECIRCEECTEEEG